MRWLAAVPLVVACCAASGAPSTPACVPAPLDAPAVVSLDASSLVPHWAWHRVLPAVLPASEVSAYAPELSPALSVGPGLLRVALARALPESLRVAPPVFAPGARSLRLERPVTLTGALSARLDALARAAGSDVRIVVSGAPARVHVLARPWVDLRLRGPAAFAAGSVLTGAGGWSPHLRSARPGVVRAALGADGVLSAAAVLRHLRDSTAMAVLELRMLHLDDPDALWRLLAPSAQRHRYGARDAELLVWPPGPLPGALAPYVDAAPLEVARRVPLVPGLVASVPLALGPCAQGYDPGPAPGPVLRMSARSVSSERVDLRFSSVGAPVLTAPVVPGAYVALLPPDPARTGPLLWGVVRVLLSSEAP